MTNENKKAREKIMQSLFSITFTPIIYTNKIKLIKLIYYITKNISITEMDTTKELLT